MIAAALPGLGGSRSGAAAVDDRRTAAAAASRHTVLVPQLDALFPAFEPKIRGLPQHRPITESDLLTPSFRLEHEGRLEIFYAPMDWLRPTARIAIVGITPGRQTMRIAYQTAVDGLAAGRTAASVLNEIKSKAAFSGFRPRLVEWLDYLGVHRHLGLPSTAALWTREGQHWLHATSAIRYPVFIAGKNYSGRHPSIARHPVLQRYLRDRLAPELAKIPNALIVPLGAAVDEALDLLLKEERLEGGRYLAGFPHPSGANGSKTVAWAANKARLRRNVAAWFGSHPPL